MSGIVWPDLWRRLKRDVWTDPTIGPFSAAVLSVVFAICVWLATYYAPLTVRETGQSTVSTTWAYRTIFILGTLALLAGIEPIVSRYLQRW